MKSHDSLGRRSPFIRTPDASTLGKSKDDNDVLTFAFMHHHGGILPMSYIIKGGPRSGESFVYARFRKFYDLGIIDRPSTPFRSSNSWANEQLQWLTDEALSYLEGKNLYSEWAPKLQPPLEHHMMCACTTASFEIGAKEKGIRFRAQQDLIQQPLQIPTSSKSLAPDGLFALDDLVVFLEADRSTEPNSSSKYRQTIDLKIQRYKEIRDYPHKYKSHFNIKEDAVILFVTTTEAKRRAILNTIEKHYPKGCSYFLVHTLPMFGQDFQLPKPMDLLSVEYQRAGYGIFKFA
jgi:hypothetical protein